MASLIGALPDLVRAEAALHAYAKSIGVDYAIADYGGVRSQSDTTRILGYRETDYAKYVSDLAKSHPGQKPVSMQQFRPISSFGSSYHNYGAAFDVLITKYPTGSSASQALSALQSQAPYVGLRAGATFPNPDPPHFELPISLDDAKRLWQSAGNTTPGQASLGSTIKAAISGLLPFPITTTDDVETDTDTLAPTFTGTGQVSPSPVVLALLAVGGIALVLHRRYGR